MSLACAVCGSPSAIWKIVDGFVFTDCAKCGSISISSDSMDLIDNGINIRTYGDEYWQSEIAAGKERGWGSSIARAAEAIYMCRRPVKNFLDIGAGDGTLLDSLSYYLPSISDNIFGFELFPPERRTNHAGYFSTGLVENGRKYDCGVCIEVIEHLTPTMLRHLLRDLRSCSNENAAYVFNTGLGDFVRNEDHGYIDPRGRGHIVSYGWNAIKAIFSECGFSVNSMGNRSWSFLAERTPSTSFNIDDRIWNPLADNILLLNDPATGSVASILARESLRAYLA